MRKVAILAGGVAVNLLLNVTAGLMGRENAYRFTRWGWLLVLLYATYLALTEKHIKRFAKKLRLKFGNSVMLSYVVVALLGASLSIAYWAAINGVYANLFRPPSKSEPDATPPQNTPPAIKTPDSIPPPGMRLRRLEFTIPKAGEQMWAVAMWENTSDGNIVAHGGATVYTIGLSEKETAPITRATEDAFEAYGWSEYQKLNSNDKATELEPHAQVITRHQSDPKNPMTQFEIDEMQKGRARTYVVGGQRWTVNGKAHGCDFCAWTSGNGIAVIGYQHNRCF
jgi:hypothetical protein